MSTSTQIAEDWSAVAHAWDARSDYVEESTATMTDALVDGVAVRSGDRILELAAGAGTLGARWSQLAGPSGHIVLSDIAPGMVEAARRRNADLPNVEVTVLDASAIEQRD